MIIAVGPFTQIVTMDGLAHHGHLNDEDLVVLKDAGLLIGEGKILAVGSWKEIHSQADEIQEVESPAVLLPGFVDSHTHICYAGSRAHEYAMRLNGATYAQISQKGGGILETVRATRNASLEELEQSLKARTQHLIQQGITTCEVKSGYGLTIKDEIKMLQAIQQVRKSQPVDLIATCLAAHIKPPEFESTTDYIQFLEHSLLPLLQKQNLSKRIDIFVDEQAFTVEEAKSFLQRAKSLGFSLVIHADQFSRGGAKLAAEVQALSADHLECSTDEDAEALRQGNVIPIVLPGASLGLGLPFTPAHLLLDHDLPLVIASDWNPGSAPMGQLLNQAAVLGMAEKLTMAETLAAITMRAARALELYDRGILAPDMRADAIAFPTTDYREILYCQGRLTPHSVWIKGEKI